MSKYVVKQPNSKLAIFCTVGDDFVYYDCTPEEAEHFLCEEFDGGPAIAKEKVRRGIEDEMLDGGACTIWRDRFPGLGRWHASIQKILIVHGWERAKAALNKLAQ